MDPKNLKKTAVISLVCAAAAAGLTRYYFPKIEFRTIEITKEVVRNDVRTVVKEVTRPDGAKEVVTEIVDRTIREEKRAVDMVSAYKPDWVIGVGARTRFQSSAPAYDLQVQRRILGPIFIGALGSSDGSIGISIGMEF